MYRFSRTVTFVTLLSVCVALLPGASANMFDERQLSIKLPTLNAVPGRYIVMLKDGETTTASAVLSEYGIKHEKLFKRLGGFSSFLPEKAIDALRKDPRVAVVEPDYTVHAFAWWDKYFQKSSSSSSAASSVKSSSSSSQSSSPAAPSSSSSSSAASSVSQSSSAMQPLPTGIARIGDGQSPIAKIDGQDNAMNVDIAIIDTGVYPGHPDLRVVDRVNFSAESNLDDRNGHGTHVAGTAAAIDNATGVVGVAPGARIWSVKVLDRNGSGAMSDIIEGIDYVTSHASEIEVANMSLGCVCQSAALNAALDRSINAGVVYVVAAGNDAKDAQTFSPANYPNAITVSAIADFNGKAGGGAKYTCRNDVDDTLADFSNYGGNVDIAAPGVCIYSTWKNGGYSTISGTSMASPHVAGAVALYLSHNPKPTDAAGVNAVAAVIKAAGFTGNFTGDKDSILEPVLNTTNL